MPLTITKAVRQYAVQNMGLRDDATDDTITKAIGGAIVTGELDPAKLAELSKAEVDESKNRLKGLIGEAVQEALTAKGVSVATATSPTATGGVISGAAAESALGVAQRPDINRIAEPRPAMSKAMAAYGANAMVNGSGEPTNAGGTVDQNGHGQRVNVKAVVDQYDDSRTSATYLHSRNELLKKQLGARRLNIGESGGGMPTRELDMPTDRQKAVAGAWFKWMLYKQHRCRGLAVPREFVLNEHERQLVTYAVHECKFVGPWEFNESEDEAQDWFKGARLGDWYQKAMLDDTNSGGIDAVPIEFDDLAIITPLLNGELFPLVTVRNVTRRRINGFTVGNPTVAWSAAEGTEIELFDTDGFVAAFDTNIYPVTGSIEFGLDFEADSPVAIGDLIVNRYGERFKQEMDNVIATGGGTDRPLGVFNTSGLTNIISANGTGGPPTVGDCEGLMFAVKKQYRAEAGVARSVFVSNETTYQRMRSIPVSSTSDQRRVFGLDEESYTCLGHPWRINESFTNNNNVGFFCLNRYRMYRRSGYAVRIVTEDKELARKNQRLIVVRARYGGQFELPTAGAAITDAQN